MNICDKPTAEQREQVYRAFRKALRSGELVPASECAWCGDASRRIQGHHPDYNRPLMVVWLCDRCHSQHHAHYAIERRLFEKPRKNLIVR